MSAPSLLTAMAGALPAAVVAADHAALAQAAQAAAAAELGQPLSLVVHSARTSGEWGFVVGELRTPAGQPFDFRATKLEAAAREGYVSRQFAALLLQRGARWQVLESRIGATDVAWAGWAAKHHAPQKLFELP